MENNQPYAAIAGFRQAVFLTPQNKDYKRGLLWALTQSNDVNEATALLDQLITENPNDSALWLNLGQIQLQQGLERNALNSIDIARRLGDMNTSNLLLNAQLHLNHGSTQQAVALLDKVANSSDNHHLSHIINALTVLIAKDNSQHAKKLVATLRKHEGKLTNQQRSQFYTFQALLDVSNGQSKSAKKLLEKAIQKDATNGKAMLEIGRLLENEKQLELADSYYGRAATIDKYKSQAWLLSAQIAIEQGHYERAIILLNKTYKLDSSRRDLLANIKQLERLKRTM